MKVVVSHSQKQHSYRLVYALQKGKKLSRFFTGIFFNVNSKPTFLRRMFARRSFSQIDKNNVETTLLPEIVYRLMLWTSFNGLKAKRVCDRIHDWMVSKKLSGMNYDAFIGYEQQSYLSFKAAKAEGKITILDADSIHPLYKKKLNEKFDNVITGYISNDKIETEIKLKSREYALADYIITLSKFAYETYVEAGIPKKKLLLLSLGIDTDRFVPKSVYDTENFEILFVGGLRHWKGIKDLVESFLTLELPDAKLTLIGNFSDAKTYLDKQTHETIDFLERVDQNELVKFYQRASVLVLPSYMDSWGLVVTEAMACGTAVIVSENTGSKDIVKNGYNGFVFQTGDQDSLKEKLKYLYSNRGEIERMGRNARKSVESLSWEMYYKKVDLLMEQIITRKMEQIADV